MGRSRGFGPHANDLFAHFRLAFATAPGLDPLALPRTCTRRSIMQKVRRHPALASMGLRPLVSVRFQVLLTRLVAVLFIVQSPYLFTIGHRVVFSLGRWSAQLRTEFHELRATLVRLSTGPCSCRLRDYHPLWSDFPDGSTGNGFVTPQSALNPGTNPGLGCCPLSLAATYGIDISFFSCGYLDVSVPRVRSTRPMNSDGSDGRLFRRVSAFRHLRIKACLPAPRSFSQAAASFVASRCQDIHRTPLRVWPHLSITVK